MSFHIAKCDVETQQLGLSRVEILSHILKNKT